MNKERKNVCTIKNHVNEIKLVFNGYVDHKDGYIVIDLEELGNEIGKDLLEMNEITMDDILIQTYEIGAQIGERIFYEVEKYLCNNAEGKYKG